MGSAAGDRRCGAGATAVCVDESPAGEAVYLVPDWGKVHEELKRRGVTLTILWEEHRAECTNGHGYSRFCELRGSLAHRPLSTGQRRRPPLLSSRLAPRLRRRLSACRGRSLQRALA